MEANKTITPNEMRGIAMMVAEAAYKAGCGRDRALPSDMLRSIVDEVLGVNASPQPNKTADREFGEIVNYAICAYKKGLPVDKIFTVTPTDANGYLAAFIVRAIEYHDPSIARAALVKAGQ